MSDTRDMSEERLRLAESFLQEAVFRSRGRQSIEAALNPADENHPGQCGLGAKAAVVLDLERRGRELFDEIWPDLAEESGLERIKSSMRSWVQRQDALDRKRNHFLKAFRQEHGFDRNAYSPEQAQAYRSGLDAVNTEVDELRRKAAEELLGE